MSRRPILVSIPTQGLCNRLRAIASTHILASLLNTDYYVLWKPEECCNCELEDIFMSNFKTITLDVIKSKNYLFLPNTHTNEIFHLMKDYDYVVIQGGHEFKHPSMDVTTFIDLKHTFYSNLQFTYEILTLSNCISTKDCIGIHYRDFIPKYDSADGRNFSELSSLEAFTTIILDCLKKNPNTNLYLSSNTDKASYYFSQHIPQTSFITIQNENNGGRDSKNGIVNAVVDLLLLSKCRFIIGTNMSSFSDEACFFNKISKLCVGDEKIGSYHCYGFEKVLGCNMLLPDINILSDIYKEK